MIQLLVAGGIAYLLLREARKNPQEESSPMEPTDPEPSPAPPSSDFTRFATWSGEASVGEDVVWTYQKGIRFKDGTEEMDSTVYVVVGNKNHTSFLRENSDRGTINIPKELSGGDVDMKRVKVFGSIQEAEDYLEEKAKPRDPTDPVQPQPEPSEPSEPSNPLPPVAPDYGLGGGLTNPSFGNGGI